MFKFHNYKNIFNVTSHQFFFFAAIFCQAICATDIPESMVIEQMQEAVENLDENKNFAFVDLGISDEDVQSMSHFKVKFSGNYDRFGKLELLHDELSEFLRSSEENDEEIIQKITANIVRIAHQVNQVAGKETAWVSVRLFTPNHDFDIPRWHQDGYFYAPYSGFVFKFATVFKGNSTLFCQLPKEVREIFQMNFDGGLQLSLEHREFINSLLEGCVKESPQLGDGAFFIVGDNESAAIHSEPKIDGERLFFSVLPGDDTEIDELYRRWFP